jgi:hypothetical protein
MPGSLWDGPGRSCCTLIENRTARILVISLLVLLLAPLIVMPGVNVFARKPI